VSRTIVLLPGFDGASRLRSEFCERLSAAGHDVRPIDFPLDAGSYAQISGFVEPRLPAGSFVLIGESFSGPIAIRIAARDSRVSLLVLASSYARLPWYRHLTPLGQIVDPRRLPQRLIGPLLYGRHASADLRRLLSEILDELPRETLVQRAMELGSADVRVELDRLNVPIVYLHGREDRLIRKPPYRRINGLREKWTEWLDAPHMLLETHPGEAAAILLSTIDKLPP
jgi:pimeloyl-ACP methyl ester carboxylesterase